MSGQFLRRPQVHSAAPQQGQVGMPQGVEVSVQRAVRSLDSVGDAGGVEIDPQHFGTFAAACPRPAPDGLSGGPPAQIIAQQFGHLRGDRLHFHLAVLRVPRGQSDSWRLGVEVECLRCQAGEGRRPEPGRARGGIQMEAIRTGQAAKRPIAPRGDRQQTPQLVGRQLAPIVPAVCLDVTAFQMDQRIVAHAAVLHQPPAKRFQVREILIAGLHTGAAAETILQCLDGGAREPPLLAVTCGFEPMPAHGGPDRSGLDAENGPCLLWREQFLAGGQRHCRTVAAQLGEPVHDARRSQVAHPLKATTVQQGSQPRGDNGNVPGIIAPGVQFAAVIGQMVPQRALAVFLEGIDHALCLPGGAAFQLGGELFRRLAVGVAGYAPPHAIGIPILNVPLSGQPAALLGTGRVLRHLAGFLEDSARCVFVAGLAFGGFPAIRQPIFNGRLSEKASHWKYSSLRRVGQPVRFSGRNRRRRPKDD
ncbi:MAG TPA: hypothetical protein VH643_35365 [Gemmataceae bacterium]